MQDVLVKTNILCAIAYPNTLVIRTLAVDQNVLWIKIVQRTKPAAGTNV